MVKKKENLIKVSMIISIIVGIMALVAFGMMIFGNDSCASEEIEIIDDEGNVVGMAMYQAKSQIALEHLDTKNLLQSLSAGGTSGVTCDECLDRDCGCMTDSTGSYCLC